MPVSIEFLTDSRFSLRFPYTATLVNLIRALDNRKWNSDEKRWEVHIDHLGEVMRLFCLQPEQVDAKVRRIYQIRRIKNYRTRVSIGNVFTSLAGSTLPFDKIDAATSFYISGYQYMPAFLEHKWDGKRHL